MAVIYLYLEIKIYPALLLGEKTHTIMHLAMELRDRPLHCLERAVVFPKVLIFFSHKAKIIFLFKWQICCFSYFQHFLLKCEGSKHLFIFYIFVLPGEDFCLLKFNGYSIRTTSIPVTSDSNNGSCYKQLEETLDVYYIHTHRSSLRCQYNGNTSHGFILKGRNQGYHFFIRTFLSRTNGLLYITFDSVLFFITVFSCFFLTWHVTMAFYKY